MPILSIVCKFSASYVRPVECTEGGLALRNIEV